MVKVQVGQSVKFVDENSVEHDALVTAVWGETNPAINLIYVSTNVEKSDTYGRQTERHSSVVHNASQPAHGMYWH